jgi:hypothetical protein
MGYEIWDRDVAALLGDFDDEAQALDFLRTIVRPLGAEDAARQLDRLQLVRVSDEGRTTEVVSAGVDLFSLIFARTPAR